MKKYILLMLYKNQLEAINFCKENNFESGIIHHATGTGKSITGINIIIEYNNISIFRL